MYICIYIYVYVYKYKHIVQLQHLFPWGNSVNTSHMVHSRAKEKNNKNYILVRILIFFFFCFSPKIGI